MLSSLTRSCLSLKLIMQLAFIVLVSVAWWLGGGGGVGGCGNGSPSENFLGALKSKGDAKIRNCK